MDEYEIHVKDQLMAAADNLPEDDRERFLEDAAAGLYKIGVRDNGDGTATWIAKSASGVTVEATTSAPTD
jgi:hypothetical protein